MSRSSAQVRQDGDRVLLAIDGKVWNLPWQSAIELGRLLQSFGKQAEEIAIANRVIADQALLLRVGAPFALSNHPKIRDAAKTEAAWGSLRRYLPARFRDAEFGVPTIRQEKPK